MRLATIAVLVTLASASVRAQINVGRQKPEATLAFSMTTVSTSSSRGESRSCPTVAC